MSLYSQNLLNNSNFFILNIFLTINKIFYINNKSNLISI